MAKEKFEFGSENVDLWVSAVAEFKFQGVQMRFERNKERQI